MLFQHFIRNAAPVNDRKGVAHPEHELCPPVWAEKVRRSPADEMPSLSTV